MTAPGDSHARRAQVLLAVCEQEAKSFVAGAAIHALLCTVCFFIALLTAKGWPLNIANLAAALANSVSLVVASRKAIEFKAAVMMLEAVVLHDAEGCQLAQRFLSEYP